MLGNKKDDHVDLANYSASTYDSKYLTGSQSILTVTQFEENLVSSFPNRKKLNSIAIELGCGTGRLTQRLSTNHDKVIGYDFSKEMLLLAKEKQDKYHFQNIEYILMDVNKLYKKITFPVSSLIAGFGFGSFIENLKGFIGHFYDLMQEDAISYFSFYNSQSDWLQLNHKSFMEYGSSLSKNNLNVSIGNKSFSIKINSYSEKDLKKIVQCFPLLHVIGLGSLPNNRMDLEFNKYIALVLMKKSLLFTQFLYAENKLLSSFLNKSNSKKIFYFHNEYQVEKRIALSKTINYSTSCLSYSSYDKNVFFKRNNAVTPYELNKIKLKKTVHDQLVQHNLLNKVIHHEKVMTMQDIFEKLPGFDQGAMIKTIFLRVQSEKTISFVLCGIPANTRLDLKKIANILGFKKSHIHFANANEIKKETGFEAGALTVLGIPDSIPVILDESFKNKTQIMCGAGTHTLTLQTTLDVIEKITLCSYQSITQDIQNCLNFKMK